MLRVLGVAVMTFGVAVASSAEGVGADKDVYVFDTLELPVEAQKTTEYGVRRLGLKRRAVVAGMDLKRMPSLLGVSVLDVIEEVDEEGAAAEREGK